MFQLANLHIELYGMQVVQPVFKRIYELLIEDGIVQDHEARFLSICSLLPENILFFC